MQQGNTQRQATGNERAPAMQKGNEQPRGAHLPLHCVNPALFPWQIPPGLEFVGKFFQFTSWP